MGSVEKVPDVVVEGLSISETDSRSVCSATSATSRSGLGALYRRGSRSRSKDDDSGLADSDSDEQDSSSSDSFVTSFLPLSLLLARSKSGEPSQVVVDPPGGTAGAATGLRGAPKNRRNPSVDTDLLELRSSTSLGEASSVSLAVGEHRPVEGIDYVETLETSIYFRKGRTSGRGNGWRRGYAILNLADGGSITCYNSSYVRKRRRAEKESYPGKPLEIDEDADQNLLFRIPANISWTAKDIQNSLSSFVVEIQNSTPRASVCFKSAFSSRPLLGAENSFIQGSMDESDNDSIATDDGPGLPINRNDGLSETFRTSLRKANELGKPFRIYFKCSRTCNDKAKWMAAFSRIRRLSQELRPKRRISRILYAPSLLLTRSRIRNPASILFHGIDDPRFAMAAESLKKNIQLKSKDQLSRSSRPRSLGMEREYRVYPAYAYPNKWMTNDELHAEMIKPSEKFHDLRVPSSTAKAIGSLKVEVLRCVGLPKLAHTSGIDAVVYLVCGSHAFTTDTIWSRMSPMWLSKTRRACIFPLFHAYARLFAGVFDDEGKKEKDDFAGRIVLDLARCRPGSVYDVTLPLRTSAHVYTRRPRGAIRIRFSVDWNSEREALLSYIPKKIRLRSRKRPDEDVTILCADEKSFRNIALTVHGLHMPGRFSSQQWKATMREINFNRKLMMLLWRQFLKDTKQWKEPLISGYIFMAWMHCLYMNTFHLVPAYVMLFLFLMLMRNYYIFGAPGSLHNGFTPPTWTEMCQALIFHRDVPAIKPLEVPVSHPTLEARMLTANEIALGMEPSSAPVGVGSKVPACEQLEFPFSRGLNYPKLTVKESVVVGKNVKKNKRYLLRKQTSDKDENEDEYELIPEARKNERPLVSFDLNHLSRTIKSGITGKSDDEDDEDDDRSDNSRAEESYPSDRHHSSSVFSVSRWMQMQNSQTEVMGLSTRALSDPRQLDKESIADEDSVTTFSNDDGRTDNVDGDPPRKKPSLVVPEQNVDVVPTSTRKRRFNDDLREMRDNFHRFTGFLFDDRTHIIRKSGALYFGQKKRAEKKRRNKKANVSQEIDRLLKVGSYSSSNPIVSRLGVYVEPMISSALSFLCLNRAVYNLVTWMDPMLTFLVSFAFLTSSLILFVFPWRIFLFVLGFIVVGPQNWIFRILKERRESTIMDKTESGSDSEEESSSNNDDDELPLDQPIINSLTGSNNATPQQLKREDVDTRGIHRVCVPYSQLRYQRFYDWPPEKQYASVEKEF